jgi:hypothetical protein
MTLFIVRTILATIAITLTWYIPEWRSERRWRRALAQDAAKRRHPANSR